ncbi:unnamed protein product [Chrysodeixis includens]|uniref:Uncharacterized protein n=1 Tax=Chrysodeixis includens TaxID=689277 RepID=A0A9N8KRH6_CHRIL|nr:unnamed protein product [Chrysodeixis includens]
MTLLQSQNVLVTDAVQSISSKKMCHKNQLWAPLQASRMTAVTRDVTGASATARRRRAASATNRIITIAALGRRCRGQWAGQTCTVERVVSHAEGGRRQRPTPRCAGDAISVPNTAERKCEAAVGVSPDGSSSCDGLCKHICARHELWCDPDTVCGWRCKECLVRSCDVLPPCPRPQLPSVGHRRCHVFAATEILQQMFTSRLLCVFTVAFYYTRHVVPNVERVVSHAEGGRRQRPTPRCAGDAISVPNTAERNCEAAVGVSPDGSSSCDGLCKHTCARRELWCDPDRVCG